MMLSDDELFVVTYYVYDGSGSFDERVDFAITKNDIINNVLTNKYVEGAYYWTFGQMLKTTNDWLNGKYGEYGDQHFNRVIYGKVKRFSRDIKALLFFICFNYLTTTL